MSPSKHERTGPPDFSTLPVVIKRLLPKGWPLILPFAPPAILFAYAAIKTSSRELTLVRADMYIFLGLIGATLIGALAAPLLRRLLAPDSETITIHADTISVKRKGAFGSDHWDEPLSNYEGVAWKKAETGKKLPQFAHMVQLNHPDPARNVVLYANYNAGEMRDLWSSVAERLNLSKTEPIPTNMQDFRLYLLADGHEIVGSKEKLAGFLTGT